MNSVHKSENKSEASKGRRIKVHERSGPAKVKQKFKNKKLVIYFLYMVPPSMATTCAIKEQSHALFSTRGEEDSFIVIASWASNFVCSRQSGIGPHILKLKR